MANVRAVQYECDPRRPGFRNPHGRVGALTLGQANGRTPDWLRAGPESFESTPAELAFRWWSDVRTPGIFAFCTRRTHRAQSEWPDSTGLPARASAVITVPVRHVRGRGVGARPLLCGAPRVRVRGVPGHACHRNMRSSPRCVLRPIADQRAAEAKSVQPKRIAAAISACKRAFRSSAGCFACKGGGEGGVPWLVVEAQPGADCGCAWLRLPLNTRDAGGPPGSAPRQARSRRATTPCARSATSTSTPRRNGPTDRKEV